MKYSIIIPTYNKWEEALKPCLRSLFLYTNLNGINAQTELIIVANGCEDRTVEEIHEIRKYWPTLRLIAFEEPLGYTKAINEGLKKANGEFVVLLNNDTIFLQQNVDDWLNILNKPFEDKSVAVTGPMMTMCESANRKFLIFFCVMIRREVIEEIGPLDEIFSPGYGEDSDFCFRCEDEGYKIVQVPETSEIYYAEKRMTGNFPIYHEGNVTFKNWPDGDKLIERNNRILRDRYYVKAMPPELPQSPFHPEVLYGPVHINNALKCDGYMSDKELEWLATVVRERMSVAEIGSWHGRSTRALADNILEGNIYAIDHWNGSAAERDTNHQSARGMDGDAAFFEFCENLSPFIVGDDDGPLIVMPVRMNSANAARLFSNKNKKFDMIFIDAGHTYDEVKEDIHLWSPLVEKDGIICGHDYYPDGSAWPGVKKAVDEIFGERVYGVPNTSIWVVQQKDIPKQTKRTVIDCFPFNNELDILEIRLNELYDVVDRFVIVEATRTHGNKIKPLNFQDNLHRFEKFLHKITYLVVDDYVAFDSWSIERHQRNRIMAALTDCDDDAIIIIGDVDEIPKASAISGYNPSSGLCCIEQDLFYYSYNCQAKDKWRWLRILPYSILKNATPCEVRYIANYTEDKVITDGGWHFSFIGDTHDVIKKIEDTAHQEYNKPEFKNEIEVSRRISEGTDIYGRPLLFEFIRGDFSYLPEYMKNNWHRFSKFYR